MTPESKTDVRLDLAEKGRAPDGSPTTLDRRLFMQLNAFTGCENVAPLTRALDEAGLDGVLYESAHDPRGVALLTFAENPAHLVDTVRPFLATSAFSRLEWQPSFAMLGRTYSIGYEADLADALVHRPRSRVKDPSYDWAVWYPLRRSGAFERLSADEQRAALMEHGGIGRRFGAAGHAHDIRLACHGLDIQDNDFVIGLVGPQLHPLSTVVQAMRRTVQTSVYVERMGPFFVGRAVWRGTNS